MKWMMFIKHLQTLPLPEAGRTIRGLGFEGVDLTVRPGGTVTPERVRQDLPEAIRTLHDWGLSVPLITTAITNPDQGQAKEILETAAAAGIREAKLGYVPVKGFPTFESALEQFNRDLDGIERIANSTGVRVNLHLHSGMYLTSLSAAVWWLIKDRDPAAVGAYVDPGHMFVEGGRDGWRLGLDLLHARIALVALKDLYWEQVPDEKLAKARWVTKIAPFERGAVPWPDVFDILKKAKFDGWISVHSEYQGSHSWRDLDVAGVVDQTAKDLAYLQRALEPLGVKVPSAQKAS
jgi:sugar phosphate isomerase/epimerase